MLAPIFRMISDLQNSSSFGILTGFPLPFHAKSIGGIPRRTGDTDNIAFPINSDEAHFLFGET